MKRVSVKAVALMGGLALALVGCSSQASSPSSSPPVASSPSASPSGANADVAASSGNFTIPAGGTTTGLDITDPTGTNGGGKILGGTITGSTGTVKIGLYLGDPWTYNLTNVTFSGAPNSAGSELTATWGHTGDSTFPATLVYGAGSLPGYSNPGNAGTSPIGPVTVNGLVLAPVAPAPAGSNFTISATGTAIGGIPFSDGTQGFNGEITGGSITGSTGKIKINGTIGTPLKFTLSSVTFSGTPNSGGSTFSATWTYQSGAATVLTGTLNLLPPNQGAPAGYMGTLTGSGISVQVQGLTLVPAS